MTNKERIKYSREATQLLGWIFGWYKDKNYNYLVPNGYQIHHIDRNPSNNSLDNLQILTVEEHLKIHEETRREICKNNGKKTGKINGKIGGKKLGKPVLCIETGIIYESIKDTSRQTKVTYSNINKTCNGKRKSAGGYHWRWYYDD